MKFTSSLAVAAALVIGGPALAQAKQDSAPAAAATTTIKLSKGGDKAIRALNAVVKANDAAGYPAALAAAQAAAQTKEDRYVIAREQLNFALATKDVPGQITAVEAMLASGATPAADQPKIYGALAGLYKSTNNVEQAAATLEKLRAINPNDTTTLWQLVQLRTEQKKHADAVVLGEQAIKIAKDAGQPVDLNWHRVVLDTAYKGKLQPQTTKLARDLFAMSKDQKDRRNALLIHRQFNDLDNEGLLDWMRLLRTSKAIAEPNEYLALASTLSIRNYPAEAVAVVNEGVAAGKIKASDPRFAEILKVSSAKVSEDKAALPGLLPRAQGAANGELAFNLANGYFGHGDYSKAAELYQLAAQKGVADKNLATLRAGVSLAMAGQNAQAETLLKSVGGTRADLAQYWLLWLGNRG